MEKSLKSISVEARFGRILRGWDAYEGYKYLHPESTLTEEEYYDYVLRTPFEKGSGNYSAVQINGDAPNIADGAYASAFGHGTSATGLFSYASGRETKATGVCAHAEGFQSISSGNNAHAEGAENLAAGDCSHVEGIRGTADAPNSHVEGDGGVATGESSHVEGVGNTTSGRAAHAEGSGTEALGNLSHTEGDCTIALGVASHAEGFDARSMGPYSHAEGSHTYANGSSSHAEGSLTKADGEGSHAEGIENEAIGRAAHVEGSLNKASGNLSHAEGGEVEASAKCSHAEGYKSVASYEAAHAEGVETKAQGRGSHAEGSYTTAKNNSSHAEGTSTIASGDNAHAEGCSTAASGVSSHTEGRSTAASGEASHAEGEGAVAAGKMSHAEGSGSYASGHYSHAGGKDTTSSGEASFSHGINTVAKNRGEAVFGLNNIPDETGESVFQIGGGTASAPRTIFQVDKDGTAHFVDIDGLPKIVQHMWFDFREKSSYATIAKLVGKEDSANEVYFCTGPDDSPYYRKFVHLGKNTSEEDWSIIEPNGANTYKNKTDGFLYGWYDLDLKLIPPANAVRYDKEQTLTEEQKQQARENIGAPGREDAQAPLEVQVLRTGNIRIEGLSGGTKEFMPATPSGHPLHDAFVMCGGVWTPYDELPTELQDERSLANGGYWSYRVSEGGLSDITTEEFFKAYMFDPILTSAQPIIGQQSNPGPIVIAGVAPKVVQPRFNICRGDCSSAASYQSALRGETSIDRNVMEVAWLGLVNHANATNISYLCRHQAKLKRLNCTFLNINWCKTATSVTKAFENCTSLEYLHLQNIRVSIDLSALQSLANESILYMVNNVATDATGIVLTLHAEAYARAMADEEIVAALETHTNITLASA